MPSRSHLTIFWLHGRELGPVQEERIVTYLTILPASFFSKIISLIRYVYEWSSPLTNYCTNFCWIQTRFPRRWQYRGLVLQPYTGNACEFRIMITHPRMKQLYTALCSVVPPTGGVGGAVCGRNRCFAVALVLLVCSFFVELLVFLGPWTLPVVLLLIEDQ
jgi:hypothetical protein